MLAMYMYAKFENKTPNHVVTKFQTRKANSVDPDEMAREPPHLDLHCFQR